jgi:hypothetical protein
MEAHVPTHLFARCSYLGLGNYKFSLYQVIRLESIPLECRAADCLAGSSR